MTGHDPMVPIRVAEKMTGYTPRHIRALAKSGRIQARKTPLTPGSPRTVWWVNLDDLRAHRKRPRNDTELLLEEYDHLVLFVGHDTALERVADQYGVKPATIQRAISERKHHATTAA